METLTLTQRTLKLAEAKREHAWGRMCKDQHPNAKAHWRKVHDQVSETIIKIGYRMRGE